MKARFYKKGPSRFVVVLWWQGKQYKRTYYDGQVPLLHEEMARQVAAGINSDIAQKGANFDPRAWFRSSGKELQADVYFQKWLSEQDQYAPSVIKDVRRYVRIFIDHFGKMDIRQIRSGQIEDFRKTMPYSPKTVRNILGLLHKIFNDAYRREDILRVPGFPTVPVTMKAVRWIGEDWQVKILEKIPAEDRPIFLIMARLGLRPGEARALDWADIDWERQTITVNKTFSGRHVRPRTKNNREKVLPLPEDVASILRPSRGISGPVFRNASGRPYSDHLPRVWNQAVKVSGAPEINLYNGTKHSLGCRLVSAGHSIELVRQLFGHAKADMTRRYAEASVEAVRSMIQTVPKQELKINEAGN